MKRAFIIGGGIGAVVLIALVVWAYMFFVAKPHTSVESSSNASFATGATATHTTAILYNTETAGAPIAARVLKELTKRKVIGAVLVAQDSGAVVHFAEAGTGHLYEVSLSGGSEIRISNTTFPRAYKAVWAPSGNRVALISETDTGASLFLGSLGKDDAGVGKVSGDTISGATHSPWFSATSDIFFYARKTAAGTDGISRDLKTGKETVLFSVPLREVTIQWEPTPLIVTKATHSLVGYAYRKNLSTVGAGGAGLNALSNGATTLISVATDNALTGIIVTGTSTHALDRGVIPEKCTFADAARLICAIPKDINPRNYPDEWYRGEVSYNDTLWSFSPTTGAATVIVDPTREAQKNIDVASFERTTSAQSLIFINKTDSGLWLLSLPR